MTWNPTTIESLQIAYGDTQEAFAHRLGCSFGTVNKWLNGHTIPSPAYCRQLDDLLAERQRQLAEFAEQPTPDPGAISPLPASPQALSPAPGSDVDGSTTDRGDVI